MLNLSKLLNRLQLVEVLDSLDCAAPEIIPGLQVLNLGAEATVCKTIHPGMTGWVYFQGSWWSARCDQPITFQPNDVVEVVGCRGNTLLVQPLCCSIAA